MHIPRFCSIFLVHFVKRVQIFTTKGCGLFLLALNCATSSSTDFDIFSFELKITLKISSLEKILQYVSCYVNIMPKDGIFSRIITVHVHVQLLMPPSILWKNFWHEKTFVFDTKSELTLSLNT